MEICTTEHGGTKPGKGLLLLPRLYVCVVKGIQSGGGEGSIHVVVVVVVGRGK